MPRRKGKGCPTCTKRRIICDLGKPNCQKCVGRGLSCPGYGAKLRWVDGLAIRGNLRGMRFPIPEPRSQTATESSCLTRFDGTTQELLGYYDRNIAKLMVWVDSDKNHYRQKVLALAQTNPAVRLAICAVSAQHAAGAFGPSEVSEKARDEVLSIIKRKVNDISAHALLKLDTDTAEWMLSSIMVLSSYEMVHSGADAADFHRKAARALVNTIATMDLPRSGLLGFLRNQLSMYDVLACTTSFDIGGIKEAIRPAEDDDEQLFSEYLRLLHDVSLTPASCATRDWKSDFDRARGVTLMVAGSEGMCTSTCRWDFIRLVDIYHNAALLYTARCLGQQDGAERTVALSNIFRLLASMENLQQWVHNLPWPVFIAGTECRENTEKQTIIRDVYQTISAVTGFKHHSDVLGFLESLWSSYETDWRTLAKQWEDSGRRILAV